MYFWAKTHLKIKDYEDQKFKHEKTSNHAFDLGKQIIQLYNSVPSKEIYDPEFMRGFMRQIHYYFNAHLFEDPEYALFLHDRIGYLSGHLKAQAVEGKKFMFGTHAPSQGNDFNMFFNETINSESTFYYEGKETKGLYVTNNIMSYLETNNQEFTEETRSILDRHMTIQAK